LQSAITFGRFEAQPDCRQLRGDGTSLAIGARVFNALLTICEILERLAKACSTGYFAS